MKNIILILAIWAPTQLLAQTNWKPANYDISFKIKNAGVTVTGHFTGLKADLKFSPDKLGASHLKASVDVTTIKTGINKRDKDLQGEQYFDAGKHKEIILESVKLAKKGEQYTGTFKVTIKGTTKQVEIPFTFTQSGNDGEFKGSFDLNRRDYGVGGKTLTMSDGLTVSIDIKAKS